MAIEFRSFFPKDAKDVSKLLKEVKNDYIPIFSDEERENEIENLLERKERAVVALEDHKIIGFVAWENKKSDKEICEIKNMAIEKKRRNRGIGTNLQRIAVMKIESEDYKKVKCISWHLNEVMSHINEKLGFTIKKEYLDEKYRGKGNKTLVFEKEL